jgi:site-specific DNA-methyltransferase (adenine-specific)
MAPEVARIKSGSRNHLYYGDNIDVLPELKDESVDLIYLDPPFNSKRAYNVLFRENDTEESEAQVRAFEDYWKWDAAAEATYRDLVEPHGRRRAIPERLIVLIEAFRRSIGEKNMTAYLVMIAARMSEMWRVLKPTGSLYLHCDPTASHYLKLILDSVFGPEHFLNEVIWKRTSAHWG